MQVISNIAKKNVLHGVCGKSTNDKKLNFKCCKTNRVSVDINCRNGHDIICLGRYRIIKTIDENRVICCLTSKPQPDVTKRTKCLASVVVSAQKHKVIVRPKKVQHCKRTKEELREKVTPADLNIAINNVNDVEEGKL